MDDGVIERLSTDEAFGLVAHETRVRILEVLNEATESLTFTELRRRVDVRDSGQFNYHLGKLDGRYVREADGKYGLTTAGARVVGAVLSGGLTKGLDVDPIPLDASCPRCRTDLAVRFDDDRVSVTCGDCSYNVLNLDVPPGVLEGWPRTEIPGVVDRWLHRFSVSLDHRLCPNCDGRLDVEVLPAGGEGTPDWVEEHDYGAAVTYDCRRCTGRWQTGLVTAFRNDPAVVSFHYDHGRDLRSSPMWERDWLVESSPTVTSREPLRFDVPIPLDDETLVLVVDGALNVLESHRHSS